MLAIILKVVNKLYAKHATFQIALKVKIQVFVGDKEQKINYIDHGRDISFGV